MSKSKDKSKDPKDGNRNFKNSKQSGGSKSSARQGKASDKDCSTVTYGNKSLMDIKGNDISWWNRSPLYTGATQINENRIPGYVYDTTSDGVILPSDGDHADYSVMRINYTPYFGISRDTNSPLNRCFKSLFNEILAHTNSSNLGFTQASLAMMTLALVSVCTNIGAVIRALGLRHTYNNSNANYPRTLYQGCGFNDFDEVDWQYVRERLNILIDNFNSLNAPKAVSLFDRAFQLAYNIYADENDMCAQYYIFTPVRYYVYSDTDNKLVAHDIESDAGINEMLDYISAQLEAIRSTSDFGMIMGAYRRAFDSADVVKLEYIDPSYTTTPYYDRNMTWQINNMSLTHSDAFTGDSFSITEDVVADQILSHVSLGNAANFRNFTNAGLSRKKDAYFKANYRLNAYDGKLSPEFYMEATRLVVAIDDEGNVYECGTEIPHNIILMRVRKMGTGLSIHSVKIDPVVELSSNPGVWNQLYGLAQFRNHPPVCFAVTEGDSVTAAADTRDMYRYTSITTDQLHWLHEAALQSSYLVNVPLKW